MRLTSAGKVKILAPAGFIELAVSENVIAGNATAAARSSSVIPRSTQVDAGLGKTVPRDDLADRSHQVISRRWTGTSSTAWRWCFN
jgi:alkyl sulfatase BDS1-like metallo-beta-lactamase superfamily hydrolase